MRQEHIVSSFDKDLDKIETLLLEMGGLVEQQLDNATRALMLSDRNLAKITIASDDPINDLEALVNETALRLLALRQPVATDLRGVVMSLKIAGHLERIGDYVKNMARRINTINKTDSFVGSARVIERMSEKVQRQIRLSLDSFNARDVQLAEDVRQADDEIDQLHNTLFRELLTYMMEDPRNISGCMHLLFIAKNIERMGDHAADIAQEVIFMVTGEWPEDKRPKSDRTPKIVMKPTS